MSKQIEHKLTDQQKCLVDNILKFRSLKEAALEAGYAENTAKNIRGKITRSPALMDAVKKLYLNNNVTQLHDIAIIEQTALDMVKADISEYSTYKDVVKQIKQSTHVLQPDQTAGRTTINVNHIQQLMLQLHESEPEAVEAEVVE